MSKINLGRVVGKSAYEVAVDAGFTGTQAEWLDTLKPKADQAYSETSSNATSGTAINRAIAEAVQEIKQDVYNELSCIVGSTLLNYENYFTTYAYTDTQGNSLNVLILKPAYRGIGDASISENTVSDNGVDKVGSAYDELPEVIKIPDVVNGVTVTGITAGLFLNNERIKSVVLQSGLHLIANQEFKGCKNLRSVHNTEHITAITTSAFENSGILQAYFPNLTTLGKSAFKKCALLKSANIGNNTLTALKDSVFNRCCNLETIIGGKNIAELAENSLLGTYSLQNCDIAQSVTNKALTVRRCGILGCSYNFAKNGITVSAKSGENYCTHDQAMNITSWTANITPVTTSHISPIAKTFDQGDPEWGERLLYGYDFRCGNTSVTELCYNMGCVVHSFMNAVFGILKSKGENIPYIPYSVNDYAFTIEKYLRKKFGDNVFSDFTNWNTQTIGSNKLYKNVALSSTVTRVNPYAIINYLADNKMSDILDMTSYSTYDGTNDNFGYQDVNNIYQALLNGKYVIFNIPGGSDTTGGHAVLAYGIEATDNATLPNILFVDTGTYYGKQGLYKPIKYKMPLNYIVSTLFSYYTSSSWSTFSLKTLNPGSIEYPSYIIVSPK